jgi:NAD(P)-dependent dehydrogenase (short-subunit alcohol dehydrogenase family)
MKEIIMKRVNKKVVLITGSGLGIGKATALLLAEQGAKLAITDVNDETGKSLTDEINAAGGVAKFWHLDTTEEDNVRKVFSEVVNEFGSIDVLVNNAGIAGVEKPTHEISKKEWETLMAVNVTGVFLCIKHVIPYMLESLGGSIINMSSIYGLVGAGDLPPYHASKGAVRLMTKNDAIFYAKQNIRINSVHPGFIMTPLVEALAQESPLGAEAFKQQLADAHPVGHVGEPIDVAYGVLYLASDESKFVTGSELVIDGGYTAR